MIHRFMLLLLLLLCYGYHAQAQDPTDISYHTVAMDSINSLQLVAYPGDSVQISPWAGSHLLIETTVVLHNGKQNMLNFFKEQARWGFQELRSGDQLQLEATDQERRAVKSNKGSVFEEVRVVIYLPDVFDASGEQRWRRKEE